MRVPIAPQNQDEIAIEFQTVKVAYKDSGEEVTLQNLGEKRKISLRRDLTTEAFLKFVKSSLGISPHFTLKCAYVFMQGEETKQYFVSRGTDFEQAVQTFDLFPQGLCAMPCPHLPATYFVKL